MANTYCQLYTHFVFAVKNRTSLVNESWRVDLEKYLTGIATNNGHKLLVIYCMPDHTHIFVSQHPSQSVSDLARDLKANSSRWVKENKLVSAKFEWQSGYGAFSYGRSQIDRVVQYIMNQPEHHKKMSFKEEYISLLEKFSVDYQTDFLFTWLN
ncbi:MAG: IS200/IS605 family transposase [Bacteroidia bacterium]|nr:IS200/IS605 family transposase [Bacteroidia bacterium]